MNLPFSIIGAAPQRLPGVLLISTLLFIIAGEAAMGAGVELRQFSRSELKTALRAHGFDEKIRSVGRLPAGAGLKITLTSGEVVEFTCGGTLSPNDQGMHTKGAGESRSRALSVGDSAQAVSISPPDAGLTISMVVDPDGRFGIASERSSDHGPSLIYSARDLSRPVGSTPVSGTRTRIFSNAGGVLVVGDDRTRSRDQALVVLKYRVENDHLVELERIPVPRPNVWIKGWLVAEDAHPDGSEVALVLLRDSPFSHRRFRFELGDRILSSVPKGGDYGFYLACDPLPGS